MRVVSESTWNQLKDMSDSEFDGSVVLEVGVGTFENSGSPRLADLLTAIMLSGQNPTPEVLRAAGERLGFDRAKIEQLIHDIEREGPSHLNAKDECVRCKSPGPGLKEVPDYYGPGKVKLCPGCYKLWDEGIPSDRKNSSDLDVKKMLKWIQEHVEDKGLIPADMITSQALLKAFPELGEGAEGMHYATQVVERFLRERKNASSYPGSDCPEFSEQIKKLSRMPVYVSSKQVKEMHEEHLKSCDFCKGKKNSAMSRLDADRKAVAGLKNDITAEEFTKSAWGITGTEWRAAALRDAGLDESSATKSWDSLGEDVVKKLVESMHVFQNSRADGVGIDHFSCMFCKHEMSRHGGEGCRDEVGGEPCVCKYGRGGDTGFVYSESVPGDVAIKEAQSKMRRQKGMKNAGTSEEELSRLFPLGSEQETLNGTKFIVKGYEKRGSIWFIKAQSGTSAWDVVPSNVNQSFENAAQCSACGKAAKHEDDCPVLAKLKAAADKAAGSVAKDLQEKGGAAIEKLMKLPPVENEVTDPGECLGCGSKSFTYLEGGVSKCKECGKLRQAQVDTPKRGFNMHRTGYPSTTKLNAEEHGGGVDKFTEKDQGKIWNSMPFARRVELAELVGQGEVANSTWEGMTAAQRSLVTIVIKNAKLGNNGPSQPGEPYCDACDSLKVDCSCPPKENASGDLCVCGHLREGHNSHGIGKCKEFPMGCSCNSFMLKIAAEPKKLGGGKS